MSSRSIQTASANWGELESIVGARNVRAAMSEDCVLGVQPTCIVEPGTQEEVALVLTWANAHSLRVLPRGNGTKLEWGNAPRGADLVLSLRRLNRVLEHAWADMTATVDAGCTVQRLQQTLALHKQRLSIDVLWPERATIGGILATNDSGALRLRFGSLRDLIIGMTVALPDGTLARSGGKVVKNVAGYDLPKLMTGSLGSLAVITQAIFRLHPSPLETRSLAFAAPTAQEANRFMMRVLDSQLAYVAMQLRLSHDSQPMLDVLFEGTEAGVSAQAAQIREMARTLLEAPPENAPWNAREKLWHNAESAVIASVSVLPSEIAAAADLIAAQCGAARLEWSFVAQATGLLTLRIEGSNPDSIVDTVARLRAKFESKTGSLVVRHNLRGASNMLDSWGDVGTALPLMRRIKQQFDPKATLNPGRFVGGI